MKIIYLVRHGRSTANQKGLLAGRTPNVKLDEIGTAQAESLGNFFSEKQIHKLVSSPLERCLVTAEKISQHQKKPINLIKSDEFLECDYGSWSNKKINKLSSLPLWKTIQQAPSQVTFPQGESMMQMATRASNGLMNLISNLRKSEQNLVIVTHADLIKALLANALGMHLDHFQKIIIDPASISTLTYQDNKLFVAGVNDKAHLKLIDNKTLAPSGAILGGGAG